PAVGWPRVARLVAPPLSQRHGRLSRASGEPFRMISDALPGRGGWMHPFAGAASLTQTPPAPMSGSVQMRPAAHRGPAATGDPSHAPRVHVSPDVHTLPSLQASPSVPDPGPPLANVVAVTW